MRVVDLLEFGAVRAVCLDPDGVVVFHHQQGKGRDQFLEYGLGCFHVRD